VLSPSGISNEGSNFHGEFCTRLIPGEVLVSVNCLDYLLLGEASLGVFIVRRKKFGKCSVKDFFLEFYL